MMKNKKMIMVFMLIIAFLFVMITCTQATGDGGLVVTPVNNEQTNNGTNNNATNNEQSNTNNETNNAVTNNGTNDTKLPQTGVEENTVLLFGFITVAIVSAVYAYVKIRKYNKI